MNIIQAVEATLSEKYVRRPGWKKGWTFRMLPFGGPALHDENGTYRDKDQLYRSDYLADDWEVVK